VAEAVAVAEDAAAAEAVAVALAAEGAVAPAACHGVPAGGASLKHLSAVPTDVVRDGRPGGFELVIHVLFATLPTSIHGQRFA
jgi:hypothetical protein